MAVAAQSTVRGRSRLFCDTLLAVAAALCVITAARIEYWNWKAGGVIQQKLENEPNSRWRIGTYAGNLSYAKTEIRARDRVLEGAPLSVAEEQEAQAVAQARVPLARNRVGTLLRDWGILQYPLSLAVMVMSFFMGAREEHGSRKVYLWPAAAAGTALFLAIYRDYWRALGM